MNLHVFPLVAFALWPLPQVAADAPPAEQGQAPVRRDARPAWAWSDEERFAALVDEAAAARRLQAHRSTGLENAGGRAAQPIDAIDGRRDPHLYFAWELFQRMVTGAYPDDVAAGLAYRESKEGVRKSLGLPDDLWERMEPMVAAYRAARQQERDEALASAGVGQDAIAANAMAVEVCAQRHRALVEAQQTFGDRFDRFLYLGVAPTMYRVTLRRPGQEVLRIAKGDCE